MRISDKEAVFAAIFVLIVGVVLGASGIGGLIEVSREHPAVSRFLLGYTLLWSGVGIFVQRTHKRTLINAIRAASNIAAHGHDKQA